MNKVKTPEESVVLAFDFGRELQVITMATVSVAIHGSGVDPSVSTFLVGAHQISGNKVLQRIGGGVDGVRYLVKCIAQRGDDIIVRKDIIHVED